MLKRYLEEANEFSKIPDEDSKGTDIGHKGKVMADPKAKEVDVGVYKDTVDNQVEEGMADEGGANVVAKSIGADGSLFDKSESLMSGDDDDMFDDDDDDIPGGRPCIDEEPDDEKGVSYGNDDDD